MNLKHKSLSPQQVPGINVVTISCLNLTNEVIHNLPFDTDPPPRDYSVGFWRLKRWKKIPLPPPAQLPKTLKEGEQPKKT